MSDEGSQSGPPKASNRSPLTEQNIPPIDREENADPGESDEKAEDSKRGTSSSMLLRTAMPAAAFDKKEIIIDDSEVEDLSGQSLASSSSHIAGFSVGKPLLAPPALANPVRILVRPKTSSEPPRNVAKLIPTQEQQRTVTPASRPNTVEKLSPAQKKRPAFQRTAFSSYNRKEITDSSKKQKQVTIDLSKTPFVGISQPPKDKCNLTEDEAAFVEATMKLSRCSSEQRREEVSSLTETIQQQEQQEQNEQHRQQQQQKQQQQQQQQPQQQPQQLEVMQLQQRQQQQQQQQQQKQKQQMVQKRTAPPCQALPPPPSRLPKNM